MSRELVLDKLALIEIAKDWKIVLDIVPISEKIRLTFYKKSGIKVTWFTKDPIWLFLHWDPKRELIEYSYEELLEKLEKYPFLLETETEFGNER